MKKECNKIKPANVPMFDAHGKPYAPWVAIGQTQKQGVQIVNNR